MSQNIFVVSGQVVMNNSKINWPDLNFPNSGLTILRTLHSINYKDLKIQLDDADGPWFDVATLPEGTGFYQKITAKSKKN